MRLQKRLIKLEKEYSIIDRPLVRIYQKEGLVRLIDGREMTIEEYRHLVASGEINQFRKETLVKKMVLKNTITILNGGRR